MIPKTNTALGRGATKGRVVDAVFRSRDEDGAGAEFVQAFGDALIMKLANQTKH
jgi:hypothetical protein